MDRRGTGYTRVQSQEQIECFGIPHLADDEPVGAHAQCLLDEPPQRDLTGSFEARLPPLQGDEIRRIDGELEGLLDGDDAVIGRTRRDQCSQEGGLAGVRRSGDEDAATGRHRVAEDLGRRRLDRAGQDQLVEIAVRGQELADIDRPVNLPNDQAEIAACHWCRAVASGASLVP